MNNLKNIHDYGNHYVPDGLLVEMLSYPQVAEQLVDKGGRGIIAHDHSGRIFFFNNEAEKITGVDRNDVLGRNYCKTLGGIFGKDCFTCSNGRGEMEGCEYSIKFKTKRGKPKNIKMAFTEMNDKAGKKMGGITSFIDISNALSHGQSDGRPAVFSNIIGGHKKMVEVYQQITNVAAYDYPVHISGETGTGKELVARAVHDQSPRRGGPFVPINCGALPEGLVESELFGHVKGAFSGAVRDKKGRFELADGGTIFLDEVAELSKYLQVKLLRFLQDGLLEKVGSEKATSVNVRVISATNKDLKKEVRRDRFRDDLFYRLNVVPISLPPLGERRSDISLLVNHFLDEASRQYKKDRIEVTDDVLMLLTKYKWPGNVRELQNVIQFAIVKCNGIQITPFDLPLEIYNKNLLKAKKGSSKKINEENVRNALIRSGGNKAKTARLLNIGRATLYRFLEDHSEIEATMNLEENEL